MDLVKYINRIRFLRWYWLGRRRIKKQIDKAISVNRKIKIIIGAGGTQYDSWISTDLPHFDILKKSDWEFFLGNSKIDNLLSEHVLEHLTEEQVAKVLQFANHFLQEGGCFRIAVPDAYHSNPEYIDHVRPGGTGAGADDHKSFWSIDSLSSLCIQNNLKPNAIEFFDSHGKLFSEVIQEENGPILRSITKDFKAKVSNFSSLVIDAVKI